MYKDHVGWDFTQNKAMQSPILCGEAIGWLIPTSKNEFKPAFDLLCASVSLW